MSLLNIKSFCGCNEARSTCFAKIISLFLCLCISSPSLAAKISFLRTFGDVAQVANPLSAAGIASQDRGAGHFALIYSQEFALLHASKLIGAANKWEAGKRPYKANKKNRHDGMPSGHTQSAWSAASYIRVFHENPYLSIPFYATSIITGYSRVQTKEHTIWQVVAGAALAELVTYVNSQMEWNKNYAFTSVQIGRNGGSLSLEVRF
ncbi:MAG: phosphatase PAP2 family protein [Rickettsiaceae bacterium]|nr:phosphatase PAP2 family protein [Rickettsiaceae bacterium]